jgi:hypothetical protein
MIEHQFARLVYRQPIAFAEVDQRRHERLLR